MNRQTRKYSGHHGWPQQEEFRHLRNSLTDDSPSERCTDVSMYEGHKEEVVFVPRHEDKNVLCSTTTKEVRLKDNLRQTAESRGGHNNGFTVRYDVQYIAGSIHWVVLVYG